METIKTYSALSALIKPSRTWTQVGSVPLSSCQTRTCPSVELVVCAKREVIIIFLRVSSTNEPRAGHAPQSDHRGSSSPRGCYASVPSGAGSWWGP